MERLDALVVDVDEGEVIELLQQEVARIIVDGAAPVALQRVEEHLEGRAVEDVLARMDLEADIAARFVIGVEDRPPALGQLGEGRVDEPRRPLRPGIGEGPCDARR